jgi:hypothetical protein
MKLVMIIVILMIGVQYGLAALGIMEPIGFKAYSQEVLKGGDYDFLKLTLCK